MKFKEDQANFRLLNVLLYNSVAEGVLLLPREYTQVDWFWKAASTNNKLSTNLYLDKIQVYIPTQKLLDNFGCFQNQNTYIINKI